MIYLKKACFKGSLRKFTGLAVKQWVVIKGYNPERNLCDSIFARGFINLVLLLVYHGF